MMGVDMRHFSKADKRAAMARCGGQCEHCTAKLAPGNVEFDHRIPYATSRDSSLANIDVLSRNCHATKSYKIDIPRIAKGVRLADRHVGIQSRASQPMPCGRNTGFKKTMRKGVVSRFNMGQMLRKMGLVK